MENSKKEAKFVVGDGERRETPVENGEKTMNSKDDGDNNETLEKVEESYLKVEGDLNDLFDGILKRKLQIHGDMEKLRTWVIGLMKQVSPAPGAEGAHRTENHVEQENALRVLQAENASLRKEVEHLNGERSELDSFASKLQEKLKKYEKESLKHPRFSFSDSRCYSTDEFNDSDISIINESEASTLPDHKIRYGPVRAESIHENEEEADKKDKEEMGQPCKESEVMNQWFESKWTDVKNSLLKGKFIDETTILDVLFRTLWESYEFSISTMSMQLRKLSINLNFPYSPESAEHKDAELVLPEEVEHALKECMFKIEPKDTNRIFKDRLFEKEFMKKLSTEKTEYLNGSAKFNSYISECLILCDRLFYNSKGLSLACHKIGDTYDDMSFDIWTGSGRGKVDYVIFPALVRGQKDQRFTLRRGLVSTMVEL